jgi:Uma2 family endonuclease
MAVRQRLSVEEYLALPEEKPYLEYENGEVVQKVAPDIRHMRLADELQFRLRLYRMEHGGDSGPEARVEFRVPGGKVFRLPDVSYWAAGRPMEGGQAMLPPTLTAEIRSPGQSMEDLGERCRFFRSHGVDVCWLIDPDTRTIESYEGDGAAQTLREEDTLVSQALPGFELLVKELFAALDR